MRRGSTYHVTIKVGGDITAFDVIHVAFRNTKRTIIVKAYPEEVIARLSEGVTYLKTVLTQEDTLKFKEGQPVEGQVRCKSPNGITYGTAIFTVAETVDPIIEDGVI